MEDENVQNQTSDFVLLFTYSANSNDGGQIVQLTCVRVITLIYSTNISKSTTKREGF